MDETHEYRKETSREYKVDVVKPIHATNDTICEFTGRLLLMLARKRLEVFEYRSALMSAPDSLNSESNTPWYIVILRDISVFLLACSTSLSGGPVEPRPI